MESRTWEKLDTWLSVLTLLCLYPGLLAQLQMPQTNVVVIQGQTVVLQASYSGGDLSSATISWNYLSDPTVIISYLRNPVVSEQYTNRVGFVYPMPNNNLSIYINNTVESDSGKYMCQIIPVGTSGSLQELTLNVMVPPATPICKLEGKPEVKANVTLTCLSSSGKPVPIYKWSKTSPNSEFFFSPMLNQVNGTLKLNNLSSNMSGKYECTASNSAGEAKCYTNLEVITSNAGVIAGATVGALVGLILIILVIVFMCTRRKKDTEEDLANDIKEDAQAPKRVSWAKSGTGSDIISKNGTLSSVRSSPLPQDTHDHHHHHHHHHYPITQPTSDTACIITGSTSYRPQPAGISSTPEHTFPGYNTNATVPRNPPAPSSSNGGSLPRIEALQPPTSRYVPAPSGVNASNLSRMGGVPIMVPAQNQAGSLV